MGRAGSEESAYRTNKCGAHHAPQQIETSPNLLMPGGTEAWFETLLAIPRGLSAAIQEPS
jgi:hypothetical protein